MHEHAPQNQKPYEQVPDTLELTAVDSHETYLSSPEHAAVEENVMTLKGIRDGIGVRELQHQSLRDMNGNVYGLSRAPLIEESTAHAILLANNIRLNPQLSPEASQLNPVQQRQMLAEKALDQLNGYIKASAETDAILADREDLRFGASVTVPRTGRNGNPDYAEAGWKVDGVHLSGRIRVIPEQDDGRGTYKNLQASALLAHNPDPRLQ